MLPVRLLVAQRTVRAAPARRRIPCGSSSGWQSAAAAGRSAAYQWQPARLGPDRGPHSLLTSTASRSICS